MLKIKGYFIVLFFLFAKNNFAMEMPKNNLKEYFKNNFLFFLRNSFSCLYKTEKDTYGLFNLNNLSNNSKNLQKILYEFKEKKFKNEKERSDQFLNLYLNNDKNLFDVNFPSFFNCLKFIEKAKNLEKKTIFIPGIGSISPIMEYFFKEVNINNQVIINDIEQHFTNFTSFKKNIAFDKSNFFNKLIKSIIKNEAIEKYDLIILENIMNIYENNLCQNKYNLNKSNLFKVILENIKKEGEVVIISRNLFFINFIGQYKNEYCFNKDLNFILEKINNENSEYLEILNKIFNEKNKDDENCINELNYFYGDMKNGLTRKTLPCEFFNNDTIDFIFENVKNITLELPSNTNEIFEKIINVEELVKTKTKQELMSLLQENPLKIIFENFKNKEDLINFFYKDFNKKELNFDSIIFNNEINKENLKINFMDFGININIKLK